ncbi:MAG TPA: PASTA domain-containing protein, partial [Blastocatellia bacterium]|nr:PASTA domain-containing protein [Blastocatellia bacterium]
DSEETRDESILWTISRRLAMVVVLALAFVLSATITIYVLFRGGDTRVPNVIGKSEAEAQKIVEKAGLRVKIQRRNDSLAPTNTVIETRPMPNSSVKKDSNLTIVVSSGPPEHQGRVNSKLLDTLAVLWATTGGPGDTRTRQEYLMAPRFRENLILIESSR